MEVKKSRLYQVKIQAEGVYTENINVVAEGPVEALEIIRKYSDHNFENLIEFKYLGSVFYEELK